MTKAMGLGAALAALGFVTAAFGGGDAEAEARLAVSLAQLKGVAARAGLSLGAAAEKAKALGVAGFDAELAERGDFAALVKAGLAPVTLAADFRMEKTDESARLGGFLKAAEEFGFKILLVRPGEWLKGGREDSDAERKAMFDAMAAQLKPFVAAAAAKGISVTVANDDRIPSPCSTVYSTKKLLAAVPDLSVTFNTGDVTYGSENVFMALEGFRGRIRHVVLKDRLFAELEGDRTYGEPCATGRGVKPIAELVRRLLEEGYGGVFAVAVPEGALKDLDAAVSFAGGLLRERFPSDRELAKAVAADVAEPVRPALKDGQPFWNGCSKFFMYPPSFGFTNDARAVKYRYRLVDDQLEEHAFEGATANETLSPVWGDLPAGWAKLRVTALGAKGEEVGFVGERKFWKAAPYKPGTYPKAPVSVRESARIYFDWLYAMKNSRLVRETGVGDPDYAHNCYPTKMYAALAQAMVRYAELRPEKRDEILLTARRCCDYLISVSEPADAPLAHFPPTYQGARMAAGKFAGQVMMCYPAHAGKAYLAVHAVTKDEKYLAAAERIAATYVKLQGKDGTWCLNLRTKDGEELCENRLFPMDVIEFMETLFDVTGKSEYRASADRAFAFVEKGPMRDWNWEGQFEDCEPTARYRNLTKHPACSTAIYLLRRFPGDRARLGQARELLRFAADQFVCWEKPARGDFSSGALDVNGWYTGVKAWKIVPGVLEQYYWMVPIDASNAKLIRTYLALYRAEGRPLDLAKARTLGESIVRAQAALGTGSIPTHWVNWDMLPKSEPWINCGIAAALSLMELDAADASARKIP